MNDTTRDAFEAWCKGFCTGLLLDDDAKWAKLAALDAWQAATLAEQERAMPTVPDQMQDWKGMDGTTAFHLIERHADNWADTGKMMDEWHAANIEAATAQSFSNQLVAELIQPFWAAWQAGPRRQRVRRSQLR